MSQQRRASDKLSRMRKQRDRIPKPGAIQQNVADTVRLGMPPEHGRLNALWRASYRVDKSKTVHHRRIPGRNDCSQSRTRSVEIG